MLPTPLLRCHHEGPLGPSGACPICVYTPTHVTLGPFFLFRATAASFLVLETQALWTPPGTVSSRYKWTGFGKLRKVPKSLPSASLRIQKLSHQSLATRWKIDIGTGYGKSSIQTNAQGNVCAPLNTNLCLFFFPGALTPVR